MAANKEIISNLIKSYWMEIETVMNYISNSVNLDGVRAEEIKKSYDRFHHLKIEHLESSLLPPEIRITEQKIIKRPPEWI